MTKEMEVHLKRNQPKDFEETMIPDINFGTANINAAEQLKRLYMASANREQC